MYDPLLGRMLSPDNYVQAPDNSQNFNRYSYAMNNPLVYTDPSGEFFLLPAMMIGAFVNVVMQGWSGNAQTVGDFALSFGIGAAAGALGAGVGTGVQTASAGASFWAGFVGSAEGISTILGAGYTSSFVTGALAGAAGGFASGFPLGLGNGLLQNQNIGQATMSGLEAGGWGALSGGVIGGISGGVDAALDSRNFFNGANVYRYDTYYNDQIIQDGCFPMTLSRLDPNNDALYYRDLVQDFYINKGMPDGSMKNTLIGDFFDHTNIKHENMHFFNKLIMNPPTNNAGVLGYTTNWGRSGHAMPVVKIAVRPKIGKIPWFRIVFNDHDGTKFILNKRNVSDYGFKFWSLFF